MVAANKNLLKEAGRLAIKEELPAMKLRGAAGGAVGYAAEGGGEEGLEAGVT